MPGDWPGESGHTKTRAFPDRVSFHENIHRSAVQILPLVLVPSHPVSLFLIWYVDVLRLSWTSSGLYCLCICVRMLYSKR